MKMNKHMTITIMVCFAGLLAVSAASPQATPDRLNAISANMKLLKEASQRIPDTQQEALSGGAQNAIHLAKVWDKFGPRLIQALSHNGGVRKGSANPPTLNGPAGLIPVSNPSNDFAFSVETGFTQSETSTAWCGSHVAVGFNDSGSLPESIFSGPGGFSFNGVALSIDQNKSFRDLGFLNPGSSPANELIGDPVLGCADANTFYYASLFLDFSVPVSAVSVSTSTDGGLTYADPVKAVSKDLFTHFLDKPWMTVDPTNTSRLFVTYTDFDFSGLNVCGFFAPGVPNPRVGIELVSSTDGGSTWTPTPVVIDQECQVPPFFPFVQGSQVTVGPAGEVYVVWEHYSDFFTRQLDIRKSTDSGATFAPFVKVDDVTCVGDCFELQGGFRDFIDLGSVVVDRSGTSTNGNVYIVSQDGRNFQVPDFDSGFYRYASVLLYRSSDGGATWSAPVRVNNNSEPAPGGGGTDQYQAGASVDNTGTIGVCWYDRRQDPLNYMIDRFCGVSTNAGASFTNTRQSQPSWAPIHATDSFINPQYMGDYDTVASDFTEATRGFIGSFQIIKTVGGFGGNLQPNPDVFAVIFH
jgi:hypothetical protein